MFEPLLQLRTQVDATIRPSVAQADQLLLDETGRHVAGPGAWLYALVDSEATACGIDPTRSGAAAPQLLGAAYAGVMIHDVRSPCDNFQHPRPQHCLGYLPRCSCELLETAACGAGRFPRGIRVNGGEGCAGAQISRFSRSYR